MSCAYANSTPVERAYLSIENANTTPVERACLVRILLLWSAHIS